MNAENFNVQVPEGKDKVEVVIREVNNEVKKELDIQEPLNLAINGNITAPYAFLEKRWNAADSQINHCRTHLLVDRDNLTIALVVNETDKRNTMVIKGGLSLSRQYNSFGLNKKDDWDPMELGNFFKINRTYFASKDENMSLVSALKSFKAKVNQTVEREEKENGSRADVFRQVVDSTLPKEFAISIPVFKGTAPSTIKVEIIAHVTGRDFDLELISADAAAIVEDTRDTIFNEQIWKIVTLAPEIPILEI